MSTNYYWKTEVTLANGDLVENAIDRDSPAIHIGKSWSAGPRGLAFTWAQEPNYVRSICRSSAEVAVVVDEYGHEHTGEEFLFLLFSVKVDEMALGERFS